MLKKLVLGAVGVAVAGMFVFGRDVTSYVRTGANSVRQAVKAEVPLEFEITRAREMVERLVPDIRQCMHVVAEQQVDIEHLTADVERKTAEISKQKEAILALRSDLGEGKNIHVYAGRKYASDEVKRDLATRFERFKAAEEILAADRKILMARETTLNANQDKLNGMLQAKKDLEVQLEQLEARLHTLRAAETVSQLAIDDSNLSHARKLITELNKQIDVKERILDAEGKFNGLIPVESATPAVPEDIGSRIDEYFDEEPADATQEANEVAKVK